MVTDFNKLWKKARASTDEAESIRTLAKILSSKDSRAFILDLKPQDAEFCIEILDHVSPNPRLRYLMFAHRSNYSGPGREQGSRIRQTYVLWDTEEARRKARTIARINGYQR